MRQFHAFLKKEWIQQLRTGKCTLLVILFCLFGIMSPAMAKLTPWMLELMSDQLAESGIRLHEMTVTAMTSWTQFYKNIPLMLIIFLILFSGIVANEYQKGTLIHLLTKGLGRWQILMAKLFIMAVFWSVGYWISFGITYGYTAYFWDNRTVQHVGFAAFCFYLFGLWLISALLLACSCCSSASGVMLFTGAFFLIFYLLGLLPNLTEYVPAYLMQANALLAGTVEVSAYFSAAAVSICFVILQIGTAILLFSKRTDICLGGLS